MIWYYLITFFSNILAAVLEAFHVPKITTLPLGMDDTVVQAFGYYNSFMEKFPPVQIFFQAFLWYMGFKLLMLILMNIPFIKIHTTPKNY